MLVKPQADSDKAGREFTSEPNQPIWV